MITARSDIVGSLLRPPELLIAQKALRSGEIDRAEFKFIEDRAVDFCIRLQEDAGLEAVTDGEMRRLSFQSQIVQAVDGFGEWDIDAFLWGNWKGDDDGVGDQNTDRPAELGAVSKLTRRRHLSAEEFTYARARAMRPIKVTLTSPSLFANLWSPELSRDAYPTLDGFLADVTAILRQEVEELARLGCSYIQIDAPHYPLIIDPNTRAFYEAQGWSIDDWLELGIGLDNQLMDGIDGVTFSFHLCRGNQGSRWLVEGGYDTIARPVFQGIKAHRLMLEYDDERSGSFTPLAEVPHDKTVVLGLVTTKTGALEDPDDVARRIDQAARYIPLERLAISPQCGFATSIGGNALTIDEQRAKLDVLCGVARRVWG